MNTLTFIHLHTFKHIHSYTGDKYDIKDKGKSNKSNISALMLSASTGNAETLDKYMYFSISKMYYARRHSYGFLHLLSEQVAVIIMMITVIILRLLIMK